MPRKMIAGSNVEGLPLSEAVLAGDFLFVSGMVGFESDGSITRGGIAAEVDRIMDDLTEILEQADACLADVVKTNVFLTDASDFSAFNKAYAKYFPTNPPARIGVVVALTIDAKVEMDFIAYVDPDK